MYKTDADLGVRERQNLIMVIYFFPPQKQKAWSTILPNICLLVFFF